MTPFEIYDKVLAFATTPTTIICNLHSACSPQKGKIYLCIQAGSETPVIDFDEIKVQADAARGLGSMSRKSVDALAVTPSSNFLCFIELKSWELLIKHHGTEENIRAQANKYSSDLPIKLSDSIQICKEITHDSNVFSGCNMLYILVSDISVADDGIMAFNSDLTALAGTSSNLKELCNKLTQGIMNNITSVETRYWECRNFDRELFSL